MTFYSQYERPPLSECPLEEHIDEGKVERVGYMETEKLVNNFLLAGERLRMFRGAEFGPDEAIPADYVASRYDSEMDAILAAREVNRRLEAQAAEAAKIDEEEKKEDVQNVPEEVK
nr:MAG: hypothetical protein [Microvirus sp.]